MIQDKLFWLKTWALVAGMAALVVGMGCGSSDDAAPTPDVAKIIRESVDAQGASTAADIQAAVAAALAAQQQSGLTRADVESVVSSAVGSATASQLSADDVQRIVDQSLRALPAPPEIDVDELSSQVGMALAEEGVDAEEITRIVQAQVRAGLAGTLTRGDVQDLVAQAVQDAVGDQLSEEDVRGILDASLVATQAAVEDAAMAAKAAQTAAEQAQADAASMVIEPVVPFGKPLGLGGYFDYRWDGPIPTTFQESPMSAELVRQGMLPPLMERLPVPEDVHVVPPPNEIGVYGGTWRSTRHNQRYLQQYANGHPLQLNADGASYVERVAKSMNISEDGRVYTFTLRNGARWSNGDPLTSEDFRFTWEDINYYTNVVSQEEGRSGIGLGPATPYSRALDPITGEGARFAVIDDYNFSFTFSSPNYTFFAGTTSARGPVSCGSGWCWYTSDEYAKQFHEKYADPRELAAMVDAGDHEDWTKLFGQRVSWTNCGDNCLEDGQPSMGAWQMEYFLADRSGMTRNHYYYAVDPEGNQLPYVDGIINFKMESVDVAIIRAMQGESDMDADTFSRNMSGIPLYITNMERGDYSIYHWPDLSGGDHSFVFNQTYNDDPEIGRWIRTTDFRRALSLAIDRDAINQTVFSGVGYPQNYVVHQTSPHYPGKRYEAIGAIPRDTVMANQILDGLGLMDTNGDGFRDRLDGTGNLTLYVGVDSLRVGIAELVESDLAEIGIKLDWKEDSGHARLVQQNSQYLVVTNVNGSSNLWARGNPFAPYRCCEFTGPEIGKWYGSNGAEGLAATGPDPDWLPSAPADTWPADSTGNIKMLLNNWTEGAQLPPLDPRKIELGKEMGRITATEKYMLGTLAFTGFSRGLVVKRNNFRNVPEKQIRYEHGLYNMVNYFEDGKDNINNPGNRSRRYASKAVFASGTITP